MQVTNNLEKLSDNTVFNLIFGTIPYSGGILSAINNEVQKKKEKRLNNFLVRLVSDLTDIKDDKLNKTYLQSEEFWNQLEFALDQIKLRDDEAKIVYLKQYLTSSVQTLIPDISLTSVFERYLRSLSGSHLVILDYVHKKQSEYSFKDRSNMPSPILGVLPLSIDDLHIIFPSYNTNLLRVICVDLEKLGLISDWAITHNNVNISSDFSLTENGKYFINFLKNIG